jgi:hypothetical protein
MRQRTSIPVFICVASLQLASACVGTGNACLLEATESQTVDAATAATRFRELLTDSQWNEATRPLDDPGRGNWSNLPDGLVFGRIGLRVGNMNAEVCRAALDLFSATMPVEKVQQLQAVMRADDVLASTAGINALGFSSDNYYLTVFGEPTANGDWGWQLTGHHFTLNASFSNGLVRRTPDFIGVEPTEYQLDGQSYAPLEDEQREGFELASLLVSSGSLQSMIIRPEEGLLMGAGRDGAAYPSREGVAASDLDEDAATKLWALIEVYLDRLPPTERAQREEELTADFDEIFFAWGGSLVEDTQDAYYRIHGPRIWIEFSWEKPVAGGEDVPHFHSVLRNPAGDY